MSLKNNNEQLKHIKVPKAKSALGRAMYPFTLVVLFLFAVFTWCYNGF